MKASGVGMRVALLALAGSLALAAGGSVARAAGEDRTPVVDGLEAVALMVVEGHVVIETDGSVSLAQIDTKIDPALAKNLETAISKWRFTPVRIGGELRRVSTRLRLQLAATRQEGDRFKVTVDSADFPDASSKASARPDGQPEPITGKHLGPPKYPSEAQMRGTMGAVMLAIRVTPEGKAGEVIVVQSHLYEVDARFAVSRRNLSLLENSAVNAARRWTFNVPPGATRDAKAMTVTVPVEYTLADVPLDTPGQWLKVQRTAKQQITWLPAEQTRTGPSLVAAGGGSVSQFGVGPQLEQAVAGMSLQ